MSMFRKGPIRPPRPPMPPPRPPMPPGDIARRPTPGARPRTGRGPIGSIDDYRGGRGTTPVPMPDGREFLERITGGRGTTPVPMPDGREFLERITGGRGTTPVPMPDGREFLERITGGRGTTPVPMPEFPSPEGYDFDPTGGGRRPLNPDTGGPYVYSRPEYPDGFLDEFQGNRRPNRPEFRKPSSASGNRMNNESLAILRAILARM